MQDLMRELDAKRDELHKSMSLLRKHGEDLAEKEHDYQVRKAQTWAILKNEGCTSTEIAAVIKGQPLVAEAMFARDNAKVMYEANKEHINVIKVDLRLIENQITREWNNGT